MAILITKKLHSAITRYVKQLQHFANRVWYGPLIGLLAALDNLVLIIPNDGILISSSMLLPKRWLYFALSVSIGSAIGALALAALVELYGLPLIMDLYPSLATSQMWILTDHFFDQYGLLVVFVVALTPIMQHPAVILASLANIPLNELTAVIFVGRLIKFLIMAYVGSHAPRLLSKMWGIRDELEEAGVHIHPLEKTEAKRSN